MCWSRGIYSIDYNPNLSYNEKKVQEEKFSQEYKAKLEKWVQNEKFIFHKLCIKQNTNNQNFSDAKPISNAVEDTLNSQAPITPIQDDI